MLIIGSRCHKRNAHAKLYLPSGKNVCEHKNIVHVLNVFISYNKNLLPQTKVRFSAELSPLKGCRAIVQERCALSKHLFSSSWRCCYLQIPYVPITEPLKGGWKGRSQQTENLSVNNILYQLFSSKRNYFRYFPYSK